jgi:hypothetical protein
MEWMKMSSTTGNRTCPTLFKDMWNVDETGLLWKGVPNRSLVLQGEKCKAGKLAKEKLTIVLLCLATGEKFKPLVIGKSQMPRAFNK